MAGELIKAGEILKIGQRLEFCLDDDENHYTSRIEDITKNRLLVAMPLDSRRVPVIPRPKATVYGTLMGTQCRYRFFSTFHGTAKHEGRLPVWDISLPAMVEKQQNREFVRVKVNLLMSVRLIDNEGQIEDPIKTRVVDLSGNGVAFVMKKQVHAGYHAALEIYNLPEIGTFEAMSRIARCAQVSHPGEPLLYHVGASFENLSRSDTNKLVHYLFFVQRQSIARGVDTL